MATDDTTTHEPEDGQTEQGPAQDDCGCGSPSSERCDPDLLDELTCRAEGVAAQAAYNEQVKAELDAARAAYPGIRTAYRAARAQAVKDVQELMHRVKQDLDKARCELKDEDVICCLDDAFACVVKKLKKCGTATGCCSQGDCDFDLCCPDTLGAVDSRLAEYGLRLEAENACFDRLAEEPAALTQRVADIKTKIDNAWKNPPSTPSPAPAPAEGAAAAEEPPVDLHRVYATLLVAQYRLQKVWEGFDCTQDFLDCLCHALTCWIKATEAVSVLTGCKAVLECREREAKKRCDDLADKTEDEVLLEYERLCGEGSDCKDQPEDGCEKPPKPCPEDEPEEEPDDECEPDEPTPPEDPGEHPDDCDCGNEHHHHHHKGKKPSKKERSRGR